MDMFKTNKLLFLPAIIAGILITSGCGDSNSSNEETKKDSENTLPVSTVFQPINLNIAHVNDHHSHLEADTKQQFKFEGVNYEADRGGFARFKTLFDHFSNAYANDNFLKLHAGDALTGTQFYTSYKSKADAEIMNKICFDAMTVGHHEFDAGDAGLKTFADQLYSNGCRTFILGANIIPDLGTPLAPSTQTDYVKPYIVRKTREGVKVAVIGLIGAQTGVPDSSRPLASTKFLEIAESAQSQIDKLKALGIEHIVLLTHNTFEGDKKLAAQLTGVDIIIGGKSHTLLGDFSKFGERLGTGEYPTIATNKNGEWVCIGQSGSDAQAFGLMRASFNNKGAISSCNGSNIIPIGGVISKVNGSTGESEVLDKEKNLDVVTKISAMQNKLLSEDLLVPVGEDKDVLAAIAAYKK